MVNKKKNSQYLLVNEKIPFLKVFLLDSEGNKIGVVSKQEAIDKARNLELDLFCLSPKSDPPVCRIGNYQKYSYQLKKKAKLNDKKDILKEISLTFYIDPNDLRTKMRKVENWLSENYSVKVSFFLPRREMQNKEQALKKCKEIITRLQEKSAKIYLKKDIQFASNEKKGSGTYHFLLYSKK